MGGFGIHDGENEFLRKLKWIGWIKRCLKFATVSILVNGSLSGEFCMEKGLSHGDPLAPFLFPIVAEGMNELFQNAELAGKFNGIKVGPRGNPMVSLLIKFSLVRTLFKIW